MTHFKHSVSTLTLLSLLLASGASSAQELESNRFHPAQSARHDYITVHSGDSQLPRGWELGLWLHYDNDSLVVESEGDELPLIDAQLIAHLVPNVEIVPWLRVSADIPIYLLQSADNQDFLGGRDLEGGGIGDIRLIPKVTLFSQRRSDVPGETLEGLALALVLPISLPTGSTDRMQGESARFEPTAALDYTFGGGWGLGANLGVLIRNSNSVSNLNVNEMVT